MCQSKWTSLCWHPVELPSCLWLRRFWGCPGYIKMHFILGNQKPLIVWIFITLDKVFKEPQFWVACQYCPTFLTSSRVRWWSHTGLEAYPGSQATWDLPLLKVKSPPHLLTHRRVKFILITVTNYHPSLLHQIHKILPFR